MAVPNKRNFLGATTTEDRYNLARLGRVLRVDYENWLIDVTWDQFNGGNPEMPIPMAFSTPRAVLGGMPEVGATVVSDFTQDNPYKSKAVPVSYLPTGFRAGINQELQHDQRLLIPGLSQPIFRRKFRKLWPGELIGSSSQGSDWILDEHVFLQDSKGDEIRLDNRDQSINFIAMQKKSVTDASRSYDGWIYRHIEESYNEDGSLNSIKYEPDTYQPYIIDESFKKRWYRTLSGEKTTDDYFLEDNNQYAPLVEVRREIREIGYGYLPLSDENVESNQWQEKNKEGNFVRGNIIETSSGTLVGYDPNHVNYGRVLRPQIFKDTLDSSVTVREFPIIEADYDFSPDQTPIRYLATAHMWKMPLPYAQTRLYVTKEGHLSLHVGATWELEDCPFEPKMVNELGSGRSVEANFAGSIRAVIDKNREREESLDLKTVGKVYFHFGKDDGVPSAVRREYTVDGSTYLGGVVRPKLTQAQGKEPTAREWSIEGITDGGISLRVGNNHGRNIREFEMNGFTSEGDHRTVGMDVRDVGRTKYPAGDEFYRHHDLRFAGNGAPGRIGTNPEDKRSPFPLTNPNLMGSSLDAHLTGNAFLRLGTNSDKVSLALDAKGGLVGWLGAENKDNRSITLSLDGGIEAAIGRMATSGNSIQATLEGGINLKIRGNNPSQTNFYEFEGDQKIKYVGQHEVEVKGILKEDISVDRQETIGGMKTTTVLRNYLLSVTGTRIAQIGNVPPETVADKVSIQTGNRELQIETKGDIKYETRMGKILIQTLIGDAEFKAALGKILIEAMAGEINIQSPGVSCGVPGPKFKLVHEYTPCILAGIPHGLPLPPALLTMNTKAN